MPGSGVTGDWKALEAIAKKLGGLAGQNAKTAINSALAEAEIELVAEGFRDEREPSGRPWENKRFPDGKPVLYKTGKLSSKWRKIQVTSREFTIGPPVGSESTFKFAQFGTGIFGRKGKPIKPKKAKRLAWKTSDGWAFAKQVEGSPKRRMVPDKGRLPALWKQRLGKRAKDTLRELLNKR